MRQVSKFNHYDVVPSNFYLLFSFRDDRLLLRSRRYLKVFHSWVLLHYKQLRKTRLMIIYG